MKLESNISRKLKGQAQPKPKKVTRSGNAPQYGTEGTGAPGHIKENGQHSDYWVLSEEERGKGFVRPVRHKYLHTGIAPTHQLRELTEQEKERYQNYSYVKYEKYPEEQSIVGRYWTQEQLDSGCGSVTTMMTDQIAETYARDPKFYGSTFCVSCGDHFAVEQFTWEGTNETVGS